MQLEEYFENYFLLIFIIFLRKILHKYCKYWKYIWNDDLFSLEYWGINCAATLPCVTQPSLKIYEGIDSN